MQSNVPNLDAMSSEELMQFWLHHQRGMRYRELFPLGGTGTRKATAALAAYASNKATAQRERVKGNIETALQYEAICDRVYAQLPSWAKW